jgi:solute carrier family 25 protein 14/30
LRTGNLNHSNSIAPALLRQASYGTLKIGLYHHLKKMNPGEETVLKNVLAGMTSGAVASAIANPTDVLKVSCRGT